MSVKGFGRHKNGKAHPVHGKKGVDEKSFSVTEKGMNDKIEVKIEPRTKSNNDITHKEKIISELKNMTPDERYPILKAMQPNERREALKKILDISEEQIKNSKGIGSHTFLSKELAEEYGNGNLLRYDVRETKPYNGKRVWVVAGPTKHWIDEKYRSPNALATQIEEQWTDKIIK